MLTTVPMPNGGDTDTLIVWGLVTVLLALSSLVGFMIKTYKKVSYVDNIVNNVAPGDPNLMDRVVRLEDSFKEVEKDLSIVIADQKEFHQKGWATLPADLSNSSALTSTVRTIQNDINRLGAKLESHISISTAREEVVRIMNEVKAGEQSNRP